MTQTPKKVDLQAFDIFKKFHITNRLAFTLFMMCTRSQKSLFHIYTASFVENMPAYKNYHVQGKITQTERKVYAYSTTNENVTFKL